MKKQFLLITSILSSIFYLNTFAQSGSGGVFYDQPFTQEYSVIYSQELTDLNAYSMATDNNGVIQILQQNQLFRPSGGFFQHWGTLVTDRSYLPMKDKKVQAVHSYQGHLVYLDDQAVFSNAWAGSLYLPHSLSKAKLLEGGADFDFLIAAGSQIQYLEKTQANAAPITVTGSVIDLSFDSMQQVFWILTSQKVYSFDPRKSALKEILSQPGMTALEYFPSSNQLIIGTKTGYFTYDILAKIKSPIQDQLPVLSINTILIEGEDLWFGTDQGAFVKKQSGAISYYYLERWLPGEQVFDLEIALEGIAILTNKGLGLIQRKEMTLAQKAEIFEESLRKNHLRNGFNASLRLAESGKIETGQLKDSDNDGLWTSMYLAAQGFRYAVTQEPEALEQIRQSLLAMERLYTINPVEGFPSRSFERSGYKDVLADPERWQHAEDPEWDWKATTSSDEAIGHIFVFGVLAELVADDWVKEKSIGLIDAMMSHILVNDMYLVDFDGKPTQWGRWNPEYVNQFPTQVGDRKLNSSNILAMLQTAYHFTGKEKYKSKAMELINEYGYLENLMRPMAIIGQSGDGSDSYAQMLSEAWNHSDDEMYFLGYWGLYRYAFDQDLKNQYTASILDHWQAERPEKDALWNIITAMVQPQSFDLEESVWWLQKHPIDLISWDIKNSHRKDIHLLEPNFRRQSTSQVLPPSETRIARHNGNRFTLDATGGGKTANSAGDIWLLPYWMGRYLGVIQ
ncbi:hypothetical protein [Algoriphagus vanfongensis]|uniref:hypothetical protein n=1 Tax=Algoriphagus vanfongensis TaxID=426371 RepID=UPI00041D0690|nr:hypothetical protein [Algoriphagus vanfongensis]